MIDAFVSHAAEDADVAIRVAGELEKAGFTTWYYERDSRPGQKKIREYERAIDDSSAVVMIVSRHYLGSPHTENEATYAFEKRKYRIPLLLGITQTDLDDCNSNIPGCIRSDVHVSITRATVSQAVSRITLSLRALGLPTPAESQAERPQPARPGPGQAPQVKPAEAIRQFFAAVSQLAVTFPAQENVPAAIPVYGELLAAAERLSQLNPDSSSELREVAVARGRLGDAAVLRGMLDCARQQFEGALAILNRLTQSDPGNAEWQRDLSVSYSRLGDIYVAQGDIPKALKAYEQALAIRDRLARSDPDNAEWQRDLSVSHNKLGDIYVAQGDIPKALKAYEQALAIRDRLARSDPDNAEWQRDLSVSHNKLGDIYVAQGDIPKALKAYEADLAIADRLARSDPNNAQWQRDLSVSYERLGDIYRAQGDVPKALKAYEQALAIRDRLARSDPNNAQWQRDLVVSFSKLAQVSSKTGDRKKEMDYLRRCRNVLRGMKAKGMHLDPPIAQLLEQLERLPL